MPNTVKRRPLVLLGLLFSAAILSAEQQSDASRKALESAAVKGSSPARYALGAAAEADGDFAHALEWYRQAAESGYAAAQFKAGELLENGQGAEADQAQAVEWYRKSAAQGFQPAIARLSALEPLKTPVGSPQQKEDTPKAAVPDVPAPVPSVAQPSVPTAAAQPSVEPTSEPRWGSLGNAVLNSNPYLFAGGLAGLISTIGAILLRRSTYPYGARDNDSLSADQLAIKRSLIRECRIGSLAITILGLPLGVLYFLPEPDPVIQGTLIGLYEYPCYAILSRLWFKTRSSDAQCKKCGAPFAITTVGEEKELVGTIPRIKKSGSSMPQYQHYVESWTEEKWKVITFYACVSCRAKWTTTKHETKETNRQHWSE